MVCPKCESKRWMTGLEMTGEDVMNLRFIPPTWRDSTRGLVQVSKASVCADCGHVEFQANVGPEIWEEWRKRNM